MAAERTILLSAFIGRLIDAPQKALHCALDRAVASRCLADPHESYVDAPRPFEQSPVQAVGFADTAPERYAVNGVAHALLRHNDNKLGRRHTALSG